MAPRTHSLFPLFLATLLVGGCPGCPGCPGGNNGGGGGGGGGSVGGGSGGSGGGSVGGGSGGSGGGGSVGGGSGGSGGGGSVGGGSGGSGGGSSVGGGSGGSGGGGSVGGGSGGSGGGSPQDAGIFEADAGAIVVTDFDGGTCVTLVRACLGRPNLLRNSNFESVPAGTAGDGVEGILPDDWITLQITPDTYTTVGGYGLSPSTFGNFQDIAGAHSGSRWVAAWSAADERGGQQLTARLTPGHTYRAEAWLHQAFRSDLDNPGAYSLHLADDMTQANLTELGHWCPTTGTDAGWVKRAFSFVAPDAGQWLVFKPEGSGGGAYPGLDDFSLTDTTGCGP